MSVIYHERFIVTLLACFKMKKVRNFVTQMEKIVRKSLNRKFYGRILNYSKPQ